MKLVKNMRTYGAGAAIAGALIVAAPSANAAIDVTAATTSISTDGTSAITAIGGALLALGAVSLVFRWAKAALF